MRRSEKRTTVAVLRNMLGLSVKEFAKLTGRSVAAIRSLEAGEHRLRLSEEMAQTISRETGISRSWLLAGDVWAKPLSCLQDASGRALPYGKSIFELVQSAKAQYSVKQVIESSPAQMQIEAIELALQWFPIWLSANKRGEAPLLHYLTGQYLGEMRDRFGVDNKAADEVSGKAKFVSADGEEYVFLYEKGVPHFNAR